MKKRLLILVVSVCFLALLVGCFSSSATKTATVELAGNATTGYSWAYTIDPEGIVQDVSDDYNQDSAPGGMTGVGGTYTFTFESVSQGEATITFTYQRVWEDVPPIETVVYKATVDANGNLTLEKTQDTTTDNSADASADNSTDTSADNSTGISVGSSSNNS